MPALPITINFPQTEVEYISADTLSRVHIAPTNITCPLIRPDLIRDGAAEDGAAGQLLSAGAGGALLWVDPAATPTLAIVLTTGNDADALTIVNLTSVALSADAGVTSAVLSGVAGAAYLDVSTPPDDSGATKQFTGLYAPMSFNGVLYYMPLFSAV